MSNQQDNALATVDQTEAIAPVETSTASQAALARATVEARYLVAMKVRRNMDNVRLDLIRDCERPAFVTSALYQLPFGKQRVEGLSIRFVEAAIQHMGNIEASTATVYEDDQKVILRCCVTCLERNASYSTDVSVPKTMERRFLKDGEQPLGSRLNAKGERVYLVPATEIDFRRKVGAEVSKTVRTNGLRLIPAWLKDEAERTIRKTLADRAAADPDAERKALVDGFAAIGIRPDSLATYLGHDLDGCTPDELVELRAVYTTIRDGACSWPEALKAKTGVESDGEEDEHADIRGKIDEAKKKLGRSKRRQSRRKGRQKAAGSDPGAKPDADKGDADEAPQRMREPGED